MALSVVVLPAPLDPSKATIWPRSTRSEMSATPTRSPYRTSRCSTTSSGIPLPCSLDIAFDIAFDMPPLLGGKISAIQISAIHLRTRRLRPPMAAPKIGFNHRRFAHHRVRRAAGDHMALIEDEDMPGQGHDHFHDVLHDHDGDAALVNAAHQPDS